MLRGGIHREETKIKLCQSQAKGTGAGTGDAPDGHITVPSWASSPPFVVPENPSEKERFTADIIRLSKCVFTF